jgi:hypothetical protein
MEPRLQLSPLATKTATPTPPAAAVSPAETKTVAPTLSPSTPPPPPKTHTDVMAMQSAYGNAAMARASTTTGALGSAAPGLPLAAPVVKSLTIPEEHLVPAGRTATAAAHEEASPTTKAMPVDAAEKHTSRKPHQEAPAAHPAAKAAAADVRAPAHRAGATKAAPAGPKHGELPKAVIHPAKPTAGAHGEAHGEDTKKHAAPSARESMAPLVTALHHRAATARRHSAPGVPVASAQAAAIHPDTEKTRTAAMQTVSNLNTATNATGQINRDDFKAKLKKAIKDATPQPKTEKQADELMKTGASKASGMVKGELSAQNEAASGQLKSATTDVPASSQPEPPKADLKPEPVGEVPAPVAAGPAVPQPLPPEQLDYSSDREPTDKAMADAGVTKEQLEQGNEPEFKQNLAARSDAEKHEAAAEQGYRKNEAGIRGQVEQTAHAEVSHGLANIHAARTAKIGKVVEQQHVTKEKHAAEHQRITDKINEIKNDTRKDVEEILKTMEKDAGDIFEKGLADAEKAYEDTFEEEKGGIGTWLTTWGSDWEELIERSLGKAREKYLEKVDEAVDKVAACVDQKLDAAKRRVAEGHSQVESYVKGLDASVRGFGEKALRAVATDFEQMTGEIDQRRDALVDKLTQQYKASYDRMSAMEEKLREENKSLWQRIYDATVGLIKKILEFKDMLLNVLARAADAIGTIIAHPIAFVGNLVDAGKLGFMNFVDHIGEHLKQGFMEWLFGAVAETGITLPKNFDLAGILSLVLQVLGLTYANIRSRAVKILGEKVVKALETAAEIFKILITKGPAGLWEYIKEKIGDLKAMVIEKIKSFIMEKVIMAGITWVIGLLNPASAFFKACKAIYDIIMFFVEHGKQILDLVNAIIDSISSIAKGAIGAAAQFVETSLARTIPVIIGFLASLLGVGGISEKIKEIIEDIRKPINEAIDWVITKAVDLVKAVGGLLGFGKKEEKETNKDLNAAQAAAREAVMARFSDGATEDEIEASLPGILAELRPMGLKNLAVGPLGEDDAREILAEASPKSRIAKIIKKRVTVAVSAEITHKDAFKGSGLFKDDENPHFADYSLSLAKMRSKMKTESDEDFEKRKARFERIAEGRTEALAEIGGTGRAALLPEVRQPMGTPARFGSQPSGGLIFEPKEGARTFEVMAWNTSEPVPGSNVSHAETQFVEWFENRPSDWLKDVEIVKVRVQGRPICPACDEMRIGFEKRMNAKWPNMQVSFKPYDPKEGKDMKVE